VLAAFGAHSELASEVTGRPRAARAWAWYSPSFWLVRVLLPHHQTGPRPSRSVTGRPLLPRAGRYGSPSRRSRTVKCGRHAGRAYQQFQCAIRASSERGLADGRRVGTWAGSSGQSTACIPDGLVSRLAACALRIARSGHPLGRGLPPADGISKSLRCRDPSSGDVSRSGPGEPAQRAGRASSGTGTAGTRKGRR
jgi:hypothetical protein